MSKHRILKGFLSFALAATLMPYTSLVHAQGKDPENLALHKTYASSTPEGSAGTTLSADKAFDGITNRDEKDYAKESRWGTPELTDGEQPWISVDLGAPKTFQSFVIEWEKPNITGFQIQTKGADGKWSAIYTKSGTEKITSVEEVIHLDAPVTAQNVKLLITGYEDAVPGWKSVSIYEFQIYGNNVPDAVLSREDIALHKSAAASSAESSGSTTLSADKAFDGVINRDEKDYAKTSRWSTPQLDGTQQPWLSVDLGSKQYIRSFVIDFEKPNITGYQVQVSDDNKTWKTVYTKQGSDDIKDTTQRIQLDNAVYGRYVRLNITGYTDAATNWKSVSVFEFAIYQTTLDSLKPEAPTLDSVVAGIHAPIVKKGDHSLAMPKVPEGFTVKLHGTDWEQLIDPDGTIYQPLVNSTVKVKFDVSDGKNIKSTGDLTVSVPGKVENPITDNKPAVIPELREWSGQKGDFAINDTSKIVVDPAYADALSQDMKEFQQDYKAITGKPIEISNGTTPGTHDFYFTLNTTDKGLKEEGYLMNITTNGVTIEAMNVKGAYWATRTILQILKQNGTTIPCGTTRDYPKYKLRGFMLDVGRLPFSLDFLKEVTKNMSWYKLNDFQVHLSDNYIWIEEYTNPLKDAYSGFRLESSIVGDNGVKLTSDDTWYSKKDFRDYIQSSRNLGINIVPEIDTPAHSLALTKVRPDLAMKDTSVSRHFDHLDLNTKFNDSIAFVQQIFNEYLTPENPVFDKNTIVNIGTDEYDGKYSEQFRKYTDDMLKFIQDSGRTVRLWGSLTARSGTTPVRSKNVQMNIWNTGWANPVNMLKQGYDLINMNDNDLYMVPSGSNSRGGYQDRLNVSDLYKNWKPNKFGGTTISPTEPQMLGASYAMWNDNTGKRKKGLADVDFFDRFFEPLPALSEKMWGEARDKDYKELNAVADKTGTAPNTNPYYEVASKTDTILNYNFDQEPIKDASGNGYDVTKEENVNLGTGRNGNALQLKGNSSYVETPVANVGTNSTFSFSMKKDVTTSKDEQILFESDQGTIEIKKDSGKLGFSRLGNSFAFNYVVPDNTWVNIQLRALPEETDLYVDGKLVDRISLTSNTTKLVGTLVVPLQRIGSKTHAFKGLIDNLSIKKGADAYVDPYEIPTKDFIVKANNEEIDHGTEGPIAYAFDNNPSTIWHTQYTPSQKVVNADNPAIVDVDMGDVYNIDKVSYLPRQDSAANGNITKYELYGKETKDGTMKLLSSGTLSNNKDVKEFTFKAQNIRYLQIKVLSGIGNFASAAEFKVYKAESKLTALQNKVDEVKAMDTSDYTTSSIKALTDALAKAQAVLKDTAATDTQIQTALDALNTATDHLQMRANTKDAEALLASIEEQKLVERDYTSDSWKNFIDAKAKVEEALKDVSDITDATLTTMVGELQNALANLVKVSQVDKAALQTAYNKAKDMKNENYTAVSWDVFNKARDIAKTVLANTNATQDEVNKAEKDLTAAMAKLVNNPTVADKKDLNSTIALAENIVKDAGSYVQDSAWETMVKALSKGKEIAVSETATQQDVKDANVALQKAIAALTKKPSSQPGQTIITTINDSKNGIEIFGEFDQGTTLNVKSPDLKDLTNRIQDKIYLSKVTLEKAYDLNLMKDGSKVLPSGEVEIAIDLNSALLKKQLAIIYIDENGNIQNIPCNIQGNKIIFKTTHFSTYAIVSYTGTKPTITPTVNPIEKPTVNTGDQTNDMLYLTWMLIAGAGIALYMYRRRKSNCK